MYQLSKLFYIGAGEHLQPVNHFSNYLYVVDCLHEFRSKNISQELESKD